MAVLFNGGVATFLPGLPTQPDAAPVRSSCAKELNDVTLLVHVVWHLVLLLPGLLLLQFLPIRSTPELILHVVEIAPVVQVVLGHGVDDSV